MDIILIPGFWLDGNSWGVIPERLRDAGHTVHAPTLPGLDSVDTDRTDISLRDQVSFVVALIDSLETPVVLAGHSGGGAVAYAAADLRPDAVARIVYLDSGPLALGDSVNDSLPIVGNEIPLPSWDVLGEESLVGMTPELRSHFRAIAIPEPIGPAYDKQEVTSDRRFGIPSTVICCEMPASTFRELIEQGHPYVAELGRATNYELVDLPTGHWPQFTRPEELAELILATVTRTMI